MSQLLTHAEVQKLVHWQYIDGMNYEPVYWTKRELTYGKKSRFALTAWAQAMLWCDINFQNANN
jgi:hypothetical protein